MITSYIVGNVCSHNRLSCSYQLHQFQWLLANSYLELHRFPFITFCLADFTDCCLLELQLLVLSHILPCELYMCSYYRTISSFSVSKSYTLLLYSIQYKFFFSHLKDQFYLIKCVYNIMDYEVYV